MLCRIDTIVTETCRVICILIDIARSLNCSLHIVKAIHHSWPDEKHMHLPLSPCQYDSAISIVSHIKHDVTWIVNHAPFPLDPHVVIIDPATYARGALIRPSSSYLFANPSRPQDIMSAGGKPHHSSCAQSVGATGDHVAASEPRRAKGILLPIG